MEKLAWANNIENNGGLDIVRLGESGDRKEEYVIVIIDEDGEIMGDEAVESGFKSDKEARDYLKRHNLHGWLA